MTEAAVGEPIVQQGECEDDAKSDTHDGLIAQVAHPDKYGEDTYADEKHRNRPQPPVTAKEQAEQREQRPRPECKDHYEHNYRQAIENGTQTRYVETGYNPMAWEYLITQDVFERPVVVEEQRDAIDDING